MKNSTDRMIVYGTLWKPVFVFGLPRDYLLTISIISTAIWPITRLFAKKQSLFVAFIVFFLFWIIGRFKSKRDPEFFTVWLVKLFRIKKTNFTLNKFKGNMYFP